METMDVLILRPYTSLPSEGNVNDRYINLSKGFISKGKSVVLITANYIHNKKHRRSDEDRDLNVQLVSFVVEVNSYSYTSNNSLGRILFELIFSLKSIYFLFRYKPQRIIVGEPLFFTGWIALIYGGLFSIPVYADLIDLWPEADTNFHTKGKVILRSVYKVLIFIRTLRFKLYKDVSFVSKSYAPYFNRNTGSNIFYWGSMLKPNRNADRDLINSQIVIVYAGSFGIGYDIQGVINAAKAIKDAQIPNISFVMAGGGPQLDIVLKAAQEKIVDYRGTLNEEELVDLYAGSTIGLLPYKKNSMVAMPIKFYDYVNFQIYTISSLQLEVKDLIQRYRIGSNFIPEDSEDLKNSILQAIDEVKFDEVDYKEVASILEISNQYRRLVDFYLNE